MPIQRALIALLALSAAGGALAASGPKPALLVVNQRAPSDVTAIDPESGAKLWSQPVGVAGHEVLVSPDRRYAYVSIYSDVILGRPGVNGQTIEILDLKTGEKAGVIDVGEAVRPHGLAWGRNGLLYATAELKQQVLIIDPKARKVVGSIPTGKPQSHMLVVTPDGAHGFTANVDSGTVSMLDLKTRTLAKVIQAAEQVQRLTLSADGRTLYTHDNRKPQVIRIDARSGEILGTMATPGLPFASAATPDGKSLLVLSLFGDQGRTPPVGRLYRLDLASGQVTGALDMCGVPAFVTISRDSRRAYVGCQGSGHVAVVDVPGFTLLRQMPMRPGVDGLALVGG